MPRNSTPMIPAMMTHNGTPPTADCASRKVGDCIGISLLPGRGPRLPAFVVRARLAARHPALARLLDDVDAAVDAADLHLDAGGNVRGVHRARRERHARALRLEHDRAGVTRLD